MKEENENKSSRRINCNRCCRKDPDKMGGHMVRMKEIADYREGHSYSGQIVRSDKGRGRLKVEDE